MRERVGKKREVTGKKESERERERERGKRG